MPVHQESHQQIGDYSQAPDKANAANAASQLPDAARQISHDEIAFRAYELYEQRGREPGRELDDWLDAEQQLQWS